MAGRILHTRCWNCTAGGHHRGPDRPDIWGALYATHSYAAPHTAWLVQEVSTRLQQVHFYMSEPTLLGRLQGGMTG